MSRSDATPFLIQHLKMGWSRGWLWMHSDGLCKMEGLQQSKPACPAPTLPPNSAHWLMKVSLYLGGCLQANSRGEEEKWDGSVSWGCPGKVRMAANHWKELDYNPHTCPSPPMAPAPHITVARFPQLYNGNNIIPSLQGFEMLSYYGDGAIKVPKIARTIIISDMVRAK